MEETDFSSKWKETSPHSRIWEITVHKENPVTYHAWRELNGDNQPVYGIGFKPKKTPKGYAYQTYISGTITEIKKDVHSKEKATNLGNGLSLVRKGGGTLPSGVREGLEGAVAKRLGEILERDMKKRTFTIR